MNENIKADDRVGEIKRSFRLIMNGVVAQSMREKGLHYRLNWGVDLPALKEISKKYGKDYGLAIALWKENIRECKILATLIMPAEEMRPEDVDAWISQTETVEIAEQASMNLYQYIPFVKNESLKWIASEDELRQLCGFHVLSRMFMKGFVPEKQVADEFLARAMSAICSKSLTVGKAAFASVVRFAGLNEQNSLQAQKAMDSIGIEL